VRIAPLIFGGFTALTVLTAPAQAKNSQPQKIDEQPASRSCQAYQQAADGSWAPLPQELGASGQAPHKSAARKTDEDAR
jgi:hypothetical protein